MKKRFIFATNCILIIFLCLKAILFCHTRHLEFKLETKGLMKSFDSLEQCFPTFFGSRHPYLVMKNLAEPQAGLFCIKIKKL